MGVDVRWVTLHGGLCMVVGWRWVTLHGGLCMVDCRRVTLYGGLYAFDELSRRSKMKYDSQRSCLSITSN